MATTEGKPETKQESKPETKPEYKVEENQEPPLKYKVRHGFYFFMNNKIFPLKF